MSPEVLAARERWFAAYVGALEERSVRSGPENGPYRCPCCRHLTLDERGGYDICPVCFWEDDGQDEPYADEVWGGPNYHLSLTKARRNFQLFGACDWKYLEYIRPPRPEEL